MLILRYALGLYVVVGVCGLLGGLAWLLATRAALRHDTVTPFECGFEPKSRARIPFSLRFFLLAVIFLIFDVEVAILLPLPLALTGQVPVFVLVGFLVTLLGGLLHEWKEGSLDWV